MEPDAQPLPAPGRTRKLVFGLLTAMILLGIVEGGLRLAVSEPPAPALWIDSRRDELTQWLPERWDDFVGDPRLSWRNRPGQDKIRHGNLFRTNEFGLRNGPLTREKPPGVYRILSLGESTSFGVKVSQDETYAAVLEECLNVEAGGTTFQVLNAGVIGYSLVQSWLYLERDGLGFEPDAILLYHGFNDFLLAGHFNERVFLEAEDLRGKTDLELMGGRPGGLNRADAFLLGNSRVYQWLAYALRSDAPPEEPGAGRRESGGGKGLRRVPEADRREVLSRILELSREHSAELVVLLPSYRKFRGHRRVLIDFAKSNGLLRIDMEEAVESLDVPRRELFHDVVHPGAALHRAMGETICRSFLERVIPGPGPTREADGAR